MSPATPALLPVASEEQELLGTDSVSFVEKLVQPLNCRYECGTAVNVESYGRTELTRIVSGSAPGWLWCSAASSAAEEITTVPWWYAYSTASRAKFELLSVPS